MSTIRRTLLPAPSRREGQPEGMEANPGKPGDAKLWGLRPPSSLQPRRSEGGRDDSPAARYDRESKAAETRRRKAMGANAALQRSSKVSTLCLLRRREFAGCACAAMPARPQEMCYLPANPGKPGDAKSWGYRPAVPAGPRLPDRQMDAFLHGANQGKPWDAKLWGLTPKAKPARPPEKRYLLSKPRETAGRKAMGANTGSRAPARPV